MTVVCSKQLTIRDFKEQNEKCVLAVSKPRPYLKKIEEPDQRSLSQFLLLFSEEKVTCYCSIQQFWIFFGELNELQSLFSAVSTSEETLFDFVVPGRAWGEEMVK